MEILLEEFYKTDLHIERHIDRKIYIDNHSYQITGISRCGKTQLVKSYLLEHKKSSYLYIDCADVRIDKQQLNKTLGKFCLQNRIEIVVFDNYTPEVEFVNVTQLITISEQFYNLPYLLHLQLYPLDYEEFLAYEHKYDSSALNHFFQLGALPVMHKVAHDVRNRYVQENLFAKLGEIGFSIMQVCAKYNAQKLSPYTIYERLKQTRKISKDKLYSEFEKLCNRGYIYRVQKYQHPKAGQKLYLGDIAYKSALSLEKHFGRLFENMVFLELLKHKKECYYAEGVDFYLPKSDEVILCNPFVDERGLFKRLEMIEAFLFTNSIQKISVVTMSKEGSVSHPLTQVAIVPFDIWALGD